MRYILASKSPRRKELMNKISSDFLVVTEDIDEESSYKLSPIEAVKDIARRKGEAVYNSYPNDIVISADTIVVIDNKIIGKPIDEKDAYRILKLLSGRTHYVLTGYAVHYLDKVIVNYVKTDVTFNELSDELIYSYIKSGSPMDKAGAYGAQDSDRQYPIIKNIVGSYDNVIGFPTQEIKDDINKLLRLSSSNN